MTTQQTLDYIHTYASHFGLHKHVQLNTRLQSVTRTFDNTRWQLLLERNGVEESREFDKVVICTGANHTPVSPKVDGIEVFEGKVLHSQAFKRRAQT